jgi:hypothetical protein
MMPHASVPNRLRIAYDLIADSLREAPQLYDYHLDRALLLLVRAMRRTQRPGKQRPLPPPEYLEPYLF